MSNSGNISAQTAGVGTNWTAFEEVRASKLTVSNQTGTSLEFRQDGAGVGFVVPSGQFFTFENIGETSQIEVRRVDTSNTQVTVTARWVE
jgi:hypothetical protein